MQNSFSINRIQTPYPLSSIFRLKWVLFILIPSLLFSGLVAVQPCFPFSLEDERKVGKELYDKLEKHGLLLKDTRVNDYITQVGNRVLSQTNQTLFDYHFSIVNSSAINAFATPGGYVYINKGLITMVENESELAGVMAHEIAHTTCRHIAQQIEKSTKVNMATLAALLAGVLLGGGVGTEAALGLSLATASTLQLKYSRENEEEADRVGMLSLTDAGYDGRGMLQLLKLMKNFEFYSNSIPSYFLTHPGTDDRIRYIDGLLQTRYRQRGAGSIIGGLPRIQTQLLLSEKSGDSAQKYFEAKLQKNGKNVDALYGLAVVQSRQGKVAEAIPLFNRALALSPDDPDILRGMGSAYLSSGKMAQSVDYLRKAYTINPRDEETLMMLARTYEETGDFKTALRLYQDLQKLKPNDSSVYYNLGMNFGRTGNQGESHYYFGLFNKKTGKSDTAIFHFKEALKYCQSGDARYEEIKKEMEGLKPERKASPPRPKKFEF
jgi:beta-barrel assembly-enhancing protease